MFDDPRLGDDPRFQDDDPRDIDTCDRDPIDPRDVFMRDLELPQHLEREHVHTVDHDYTLRRSECARSASSAPSVRCRQ
jgi:hypothetical protein